MIYLEGVTKSYGVTPVLGPLSCAIPTQEFVFLMGPSGAGKSTLLRLLSFVEAPDSGEITLDLRGSHFSSRTRNNPPWPRVTAVFQRQFLWPHLTIRENIMLPLHAAAAPNADRKVHEVIEMFEMQTFVDRFPNEVSGGQATRAALARAFVLEPELILVDEAYHGLDIEQQKILNAYFVKLRNAGAGIIIVTHDIQFARSYADKIVILERGVVTDAGPVSVLEHPKSQFLKRALSL